MCRRMKKKFYLRSGSKSHRHLGFLNVPVQAPTRGQSFYTVIRINHPINSPFITLCVYGGHILDLNPPPRGRKFGLKQVYSVWVLTLQSFWLWVFKCKGVCQQALIRSHCAPLFFLEMNWMLASGRTFQPQKTIRLKREESNRLYWFETKS